MALGSKNKFKVLPIQYTPLPNGGILKQGPNEMVIPSKSAAEAIWGILNSASRGGATQEEILRLFNPSVRSKIKRIIQGLVDQRLLVPQENFKVVILGVNYISQQLVSSLRASGIKTISVLDLPGLRNHELINQSGRLNKTRWISPGISPKAWGNNFDFSEIDILITTSDYDASNIFQEWNRFCLKNKKTFLPVYNSNLLGFVGPLVVPGQTACFECLQARQNSHLENPERFFLAKNSPIVSEKILGFHPSMGSILGNIAAFELSRFYGPSIPFSNVGNAVRVDFFDFGIRKNKVLKVPRCAACSSMNHRASPDLENTTFVPLDGGQPW
ncbi:MAG: TOMM precursor leader peptide-binding protein [Nitrospirales bacterium]|nr:TOMM precursor leader peptide-binding protein [Nitrospirales bacterium]